MKRILVSGVVLLSVLGCQAIAPPTSSLQPTPSPSVSPALVPVTASSSPNPLISPLPDVTPRPEDLSKYIGTLDVLVTSSDGQNLKGVTLTLVSMNGNLPFRTTVTTDGEGRYQFTGLPYGTEVKVTARITGYGTVQQTVFIIDAHKGDICAGEIIKPAISFVGDRALVKGISGTVRFTNIRPSNPPPTSGHECLRWELDFSTLSGQVQDESGNPINGATISVRSLNKSYPFEADTISTNSGTYAFHAVLTGVTLELIASKSGFNSRRVTVVALSNTGGNGNYFDFIGNNALNKRTEMSVVTHSLHH